MFKRCLGAGGKISASKASEMSSRLLRGCGFVRANGKKQINNVLMISIGWEGSSAAVTKNLKKWTWFYW